VKNEATQKYAAVTVAQIMFYNIANCDHKIYRHHYDYCYNYCNYLIQKQVISLLVFVPSLRDNSKCYKWILTIFLKGRAKICWSRFPGSDNDLREPGFYGGIYIYYWSLQTAKNKKGLQL